MPQPRRRKQPQAVAPVTSILLDKERRVVFSMYSLGRLEELFDVNMIDDGFQKIEMNARNLAAILWAGLIHEDDELDTDDPKDGIKRVAKLLTTENTGRVLAVITAAQEVSFPEPDPNEVVDPLSSASR